MLDIPGLHVAAASRETGVGLVEDADTSAIYMFNHLEYDAGTLASEYERDRRSDMPVRVPQNYFPNNNPLRAPAASWADSAHRFFSNWAGIAAQHRMKTAIKPDAPSLETAA